MISVCILNWNCLNVLEISISLLNEELRDVEHEIIVYDQNSVDGSRDFLKHQKGVVAILGDENVGNSISRNTMISRAKYKYVMLLDSDILPIRNSVASMIKFMEENGEYCYVGYDWRSYSLTVEGCTDYESIIEKKDVVDWKDDIALTQYGVFRRSIFDNIIFPEFYPFDRAGWGAEDDIVGHVIKGSKIGIGGTITGRTYLHQKGSSLTHLGQDFHHAAYVERITHFIYFCYLLSLDQQLTALRRKSLPSIRLHCNKYLWDIQGNLGDVATDYVLKRFFPFLEFDSTEKTNLLMFGGTIFDHIRNANKLYSADFKNVLYFGVGVGKKSEIEHARPMIAEGNVSCTIVPRGPKSRRELRSAGFECSRSCGDVLQLFAALPIVETIEGAPELEVYDIWKDEPIQMPTENYFVVKVADRRDLSYIPYYGLEQFLRLLRKVSKVYSRQIHPPLISALLGKPVRFYPKDWRIEDFEYFNSFNLDMNKEQSLALRREAQKNIIKFTKSFIENLKPFV